MSALPDLIRSEWTKLRSLRSTFWTLPPTVVIGSGLALLVGASFSSATPRDGDAPDLVFYTYYSLTLAQLTLVIFGVLLVTSEYRGGTIRASLLATPQRGRFLAAKVVTGAALAAAVSLVTVAATYGAAQLGLGSAAISLSDPGVLRATVGAWLYLTLICLFAIGVAAVVRSAVVALAVLLPVLFLNSQGLSFIPGARAVLQFLPDQAGQFILHIAGRPEDPFFPHAYGPWGGVGILALWTVAALAGGYLVLRRRDA